MIVHIDYLECTCDMCGEKEEIASTNSKPQGWNKIFLNYDEYLLCPKCISSIKNFIYASKG